MNALRNVLRSMWGRFRGAKRRTQIIIGVLAVVAVLGTCSGLVSAVAGGGTTTPTTQAPQATHQPIATSPPTQLPAEQVPTAQPTATPTATPEPPTPTATPKPPTPTATPKPAPTATPKPPAPATLSLSFGSVSIVRGKTSSVSVHTNPGATLTINVHYVATNSDATSKSLDGSVTADNGGNFTWRWTCQTSKPGSALVTVYATWNGQKTHIERTFTIVG